MVWRFTANRDGYRGPDILWKAGVDRIILVECFGAALRSKTE